MKRIKAGPIPRRRILKGMGAALGATTVGCGGLEGADDDLSIAEAAGELGSTDPQALLGKIKHIVVLCQENRSFDHYLGARRLIEGMSVDGLTGNESNPAPDGSQVPVFNLQDYTPADPPHEWSDSHNQWNEGANDGFVKEHAGPDQNDVMGYYVREQIPIHHALADHFTTCDAYFASVMGPTWPNRFYLHGGTSHGVKDSTPIPGFKSIFDVLALAGIPAINYFSDVPWATAAYGKLLGLAHISQFFAGAAAGVLPKFCIIDPQFLGPASNDDHPDKDVRLGQALIATIYAALARSPIWNDCLFLVTYDEHGGFFDHAPPPVTVDPYPGFDQLGFRVPALAVGPYVRKGAAVNTVFEHASVLKTLTKRFNLPMLNSRVAAANDFSSVIDPAFLKNPQPAPELPPVQISMSALQAFIAQQALKPEVAHKELDLAADLGVIPPSLDKRSKNGLGSMQDVLTWGKALGAIEILP